MNEEEEEEGHHNKPANQIKSTLSHTHTTIN